MSIPLPAKKRFQYHYELHQHMKATHPSKAEFEGFKLHIRESIARLELDGKKGKPVPCQWRKFVKMVLLLEPSLRQYEICWPIKYYHRSYMKELMRSRARCKGRKHKPNIPAPSHEIIEISSRESTPSQEVVSTQTNHKYLSFMSTPPEVIDIIELTSRESTPLQELPVRHDQGPSGLSLPYDISPDTTPEAMSSTSVFKPSKFNWPPSLRNEGPGVKASDNYTNSGTVTASCCLCEHDPLTEIDSFLKNRLSELIDDAYVLETLLAFGICFDQHLDFLISLDDFTRAEAIDLIPLEQMNALAKFKLLETLKQYSVQPNNTLRMNAILQSILPPSNAAQEQMVHLFNNEKFRDRLQKAMSLEHDYDTFRDILHIMEKHSTRLFIIEFPVIDHLRATIRQIVKEHPLFFRRYADYWPVRIYLNYRKMLLGCTAPQYDAQEEQDAFTAVFEEQQQFTAAPATVRSGYLPKPPPHATVVTVEQVPCKYHLPIDIIGAPATLRAHLQSLGVAELLPALVYIGIRTDDDMDKFCRLNAQKRLNVMMKTGKVKLNALQKFMLELMCKRWRK